MHHNEPVAVIFVTGGLGSGKSTFSSIAAKRGIKTLNADAIVDELYRTDLDLIERLKILLGQDIVDDKNQILKSKIAEKIFDSRSLLKKVEELVHPLVRGYLLHEIANSPTLVFEIPIINESTDLTPADYLVVITTDEHRQVKRAIARGMTQEDAEKRIAMQKLNAISVPSAIYIPNNGSFEEFEKSVDKFLDTVIND